MKNYLLLLIVFYVAYAAAQNNPKHHRPVYKGPLCLGSFCIGGSFSSLPCEKNLVARYGNGTRIDESRCYSVAEQAAYVQFRVEHDFPAKIVTVFVSDKPSCIAKSKLTASKAPFPTFKTREGLMLGDTKEKVFKLYGPPSSTRDSSDGLFKVIPYDRNRKGAPFGEVALVYDGPSK